MSDFKTEYPVLYFNEYFRRKPMRLSERESEELFTLEETDVNNFEYISLHDHEKEIASLKEQLEREQGAVDFYASTEAWNRSNCSDVAREMCTDDLDRVKGYAKHCGGKLARATQARREK